jgi:hypothetical protein
MLIEKLTEVPDSIPTTNVHGTPWGIGGEIIWGPASFAEAASATARVMRISADGLSFDSSEASRSNGFLRALQDRVHQANNAGYEIKQIDAQINAQNQKITMAAQEITNQQQVIDNANEIQDFLKSKYTSEALYGWMEGNVRTLYYQTYTLAYQLAKKAEKAYCFERSVDPASAKFISFGYWDASRDGLLAGERLFVSLKQLEAAYYENRGYDFEVTKNVSLRQLDPLALFQLREKSKADILLPEVLFDMDFPGHYNRRIKSVSLSMPCVVGPYTSISATLRLLDHSYRINTENASPSSYPRTTDSDDLRFRSNNVPIAAIAVSSAQSDSGVFELNFKDERYIPFEGAGCISKWRLELPSTFKQWDYTTITDVIMQVRYTASDGGDKLASAASSVVGTFIQNVENLSQNQGLFSIFDLRAEFASEWASITTQPLASPAKPGAAPSPDPNGSKTLSLKDLLARLPAYTKGHAPNKIVAKDAYLMLSPAISWVGGADLIMPNGDPTAFSKDDKVGETAVWQILGDEFEVGSWRIRFNARGGDGKTSIERGWVIIRYTLG